MFKYFFEKSVKIVKPRPLQSSKYALFMRFFLHRQVFYPKCEKYISISRGRWCTLKTVVFVDELLLVNFAVGAALLLCTGLLCGRTCTGVRLCAGSALAALCTLALLAPPWPPPVAALYKVSSCCAVVAAAYGMPGARGLAQLCAWYSLLNLLLCGAVMLPGVQANNFSVWLPVRPGALLACCGAVYAVLRGLLACFGRTRRSCHAAVLELADGTAVSVQACHDTGFALQEPLSGRLVVLVQYPAVCSRLPGPLRRYLDVWFAGQAPPPPPELGIRLVPCHTVAGHCLLPAVPAAALCLGRTRVPGLLAAFCSPDTADAWTLLFGDDVAERLGI